MFSISWTVILILLVSYILTLAWGLRRNIALAKQSGLAYTITPFHIFHKGWLATQKPLLVLLDKSPITLPAHWFPLLVFDRVWHAGHSPFASIKSDTFFVVSPTRLVLWTCSPSAITQIVERRRDFPKPITEMAMLNIHGPTVTGTEGAESRHYRRITAGSFTTKTYEETWIESLAQAGNLFMRLRELGDKKKLSRELERITLNVISNACFGTEQGGDTSKMTKIGDGGRGSHELCYQEAFAGAAEGIGELYLLPRWFLKKSPFASHKHAWKAFQEWRGYMEDLVKCQRQNQLMGVERKHLLNSLVAASNAKDPATRISTPAILGNIWVFVLGGYHTTSNTLHFIFILLALNPNIQTRLQQSLDDHFGDRHISSWSHEEDFPALLNSHLGAVIAETMRVYGVLPFIPKSTGPSPQTLTLDGKAHTIPPETMILINTSAVHRNPKFWHIATPTLGEIAPYPVSNWDPWRWLENNREKVLYKPTPGSYISFSGGARECIGKRFAQVELCAVLARVLKECSVELAVGKEGWEAAREHAVRELSKGVGFGMALELFGKVELDFVSRV